MLKKHRALGLDIGGTRLKAVALETPGTVLHQLEIASNAGESPEIVRATLREAHRQFQELGFSPEVVGIGCAGSVDGHRGVVRNSPNFSGWKNVPLKQWGQEDFGVPVSVDNDANCAAVAEWKMGNAVNLRNFVLLTLGTGVGGGIVCDGKLLRGATGTAGELGHFSIYANGEECPCGHRGCFERYCSGTAIRRNAGDISSKEVFSSPGDPRFAPVIEKFLFDFKNALTTLANVFDPEAILLGGQVSLGVAPYLEELQSWVRHHAFPAVGENVRILPAKFGNLSGSLGAALLAVDENLPA
ncbi:ROK family protein [bacterium]|nr:ROK family protein [bacterium]